jgi:hypothetical protein
MAFGTARFGDVAAMPVAGALAELEAAGSCAPVEPPTVTSEAASAELACFVAAVDFFAAELLIAACFAAAFLIAACFAAAFLMAACFAAVELAAPVDDVALDADLCAW